MEIFGFYSILWNIIKTLLILFLFSIVYDWVQMLLWKHKYKIKGAFPLPIFGTMLSYIMAPGAEDQRKRFEKYGSVFGGPSGSTKVIAVADIQLLKKIMIQDHVEFQNRYVFQAGYDPPPIDHTLLYLIDEEWKRVRSIITPSFSVGKLKQMTKQMNFCAELLIAGLLEKADPSEVIEPKVHFGCYTMDVIASNAFGISTNAFKNPNDPFIRHAKRAFSTPVFSPILVLAWLSVEELIAQMFIVFVAGYETTASLLQFAAYVLALHPDVQDKLIAEIDNCIPEDVTQLTYDVIQELPYLDQVVNETLRMYPPLVAMNRRTSKDKDVFLDGYWFPADTMIMYNIYMIHRDPKHYPEPEKFKPERFLPEEKAKRDPFTFIPFGHGPRNCIGMRLALLEAKIALVATLRKVKFFQVPETEVPLEVITYEPFLRPARPVKVGVERRS